MHWIKPCVDPEGREWLWIQTPLENHKAVALSRNTGMDPPGNSQNYPASIQCRAIIGPPAKRH